jgi:hypothetical protein
MTISQPRIVDWLGIENVTGFVSLTIVDDLDWGDEQSHLLLLQAKLNTYLAFIESGEVFERLATEVGHQVPISTHIKVTILAKNEIPLRAQAFIGHAKTKFREAGFELAFKVVEDPG